MHLKIYWKMKIKFKKLTPLAQTPYRKFDVDAGFDLYAISRTITDDYVEYGTGIAIEIPDGYVGLVFPRSSVTNYDLMLKNCVGVIDASYRGEIVCRFFDNKRYISKDRKKYDIGDRVAQIVFVEIPKITLVEADELSSTDRGVNGFGSSGKK